MQYSKTILFFVVLYSLLFCECKKDILVTCEANCTPLKVSGKVLDGSANNQPKANINIHLKWSEGRSGIFFPKPDLVVAKTSTNTNGEFQMNVEIDTSYFNDKLLYIEAYPSGPDGFLLPEKYSMFDFHPEEFQQLQFKHFNEAVVRFRLKSYSTKNYTSFRLQCDPDTLHPQYFNFYVLKNTFSKLPKDTVISYTGVAGVETSVIFSRVYDGITKQQAFKIYPQKNKINEYLIEYD